MSGKLLMTGAVFMWALITTLTKIGLDGFKSFDFLFFRCLIGAIVLTVLFKDHFKKLDRKLFKDAVILSIALFVGNAALTVSLDYLSAAEVNTYSALQIPMIPFLAFIFIKEKLTFKNVFCALLALFGTVIFNYTGDAMTANIGVFIAILSAVGYAMYIVLTEKFVQDEDAMLLITIQAYFMTIYSAACSFYLEGGIEFTTNTNSIIALVLGGVFANALSYILQALAQKKITASETGIIVALLPVFGLAIAMVVLGDRLTYYGAIGTGLIILSVFISNIHFNIKRNKLKEVNQQV